VISRRVRETMRRCSGGRSVTSDDRRRGTPSVDQTKRDDEMSESWAFDRDPTNAKIKKEEGGI